MKGRNGETWKRRNGRKTLLIQVKMVINIFTVTILLSCVMIEFINADCDLNGLCEDMRKRERLEIEICEMTASCESPRRMDCLSDTVSIIKHNCLISDCMEVQALTDVGQSCETWFPRVSGTAFERYTHGHSPLEPNDRIRRRRL